MRWFGRHKNGNSNGNGAIALANRAMGVIVPQWGTGPTPMDFKIQELAQVYGSSEYSNVWVYSCVRAIAQTVASIPLKFYMDFKGERRPLPDIHPLTKLFWGPNPFQTRLNFWEATMIYLELTGNCFWALEEMDRRGEPGELWPLRPDFVRIIKDPVKKVAGYDFLATGQAVKYSPEEIIHLKYFSPTDEFWGLSPMSAARLGIIADYNAQKWNSNFFRQGARPSGVLTTQEELDDANFRRLKTEFEQAYTGADRAQRVLVLEKGLQWQSVGLPQKDMEFIEQRKLSREEILAVYKVPPIEVGILEHANFANAEVQDKIFWTKCVIPKLKFLEETLNTFLLPRFGGGIFGEFDLSGVEALRENEAVKAQTARTLVGNGLENPIMTVNEVRKRQWNLPPIEEVKAREKQSLAFGMSLHGTVRLTIKDEDLPGQGINPEEDLWLLDKAKIFYMDTLTAWAKKEIERVAKDINFNRTDPRVLDFLKKQGASLIKNVNDTTREKIREALTESTKEGETIPQIARRIQDVFAEATETRAFRIARTETVGASNFGSEEAYRQAGVEGKGWLTARDEKVRPTHVQAGRDYAEGIPVDRLFTVGGYQMSRPGDGSHGAPAGEIVNCRCGLKPVVRMQEQGLALDEDALWEQFALWLSPREQNFERTMIKFFNMQESRLLKALGAVAKPIGAQ